MTAAEKSYTMRAMNLQEQFTREVEAFLSQHSFEAATFGRKALNDPSFVNDLREGRSPTLKTIERVRDFMASVAAEDDEEPRKRADA